MTTELLPPLIDIARRAGDAIMDIYEQDFDVFEKADQSPLTSADLASHRVIIDGLKAITPDWPILSEESADIDFEQRRQWSRYWLVDPLDGTKEFIKRNGEFTVNIALIDHHRPLLGVVYVPVKNTLYCGHHDSGAFRQHADHPQQAIRVRPLPGGPVTVVGSRSHASPRVQAYLDALGPHELTSMGSSLKFCLIAEGSADLYPRLGPTSEWDTAAAQAVVEAAGGRVTETDGRPLQYNRKASLLNPEFLVFADLARDWTEPVPQGPTHVETLQSG